MIKMIKLFGFIPVLLITFLFESGCVRLPTEPTDINPQPLLITKLGFQIKVHSNYLETGGIVTTTHGKLADQWWQELMKDLQLAGYPEKADPQNIRRPVSIVLHQPQEHESGCNKIYNPSRELVGGYYSPLKKEVNVPGNYPMTSCASPFQILKHEFIHHWCYYTFDTGCFKLGESEEKGNHVWFMPNGQNIWELQWQ